MNKFFSALMLHILSYRKSYFLFVLVVILGTFATYFLNSYGLTTSHFISIYMCVSIVFTLLVGIYEYRKLCYNYLNIRINRRKFYITSFIFCLSNALLLVVLAYGATSILNLFLDNVDIGFLSYIYFFLAFVFTFVFGNALALTFKHLRPIGIALIIILAILTFIFNDAIKTAAFDSVWIALDFLINKLYFIAIFVVTTSLLYLFVYYKIITINVQHVK